jgi:hypothetical protein
MSNDDSKTDYTLGLIEGMNKRLVEVQSYNAQLRVMLDESSSSIQRLKHMPSVEPHELEEKWRKNPPQFDGSDQWRRSCELAIMDALTASGVAARPGDALNAVVKIVEAYALRESALQNKLTRTERDLDEALEIQNDRSTGFEEAQFRLDDLQRKADILTKLVEFAVPIVRASEGRSLKRVRRPLFGWKWAQRWRAEDAWLMNAKHVLEKA